MPFALTAFLENTNKSTKVTKRIAHTTKSILAIVIILEIRSTSSGVKNFVLSYLNTAEYGIKLSNALTYSHLFSFEESFFVEASTSAISDSVANASLGSVSGYVTSPNS